VSAEGFNPRVSTYHEASRSALRITFGRACRETRVGQAMTQQRLAEHVGVTHGYIAKIERGRANPTLEMVARIASALGLELALSIRQPLVLGADQRDIVHAWCSGYVDRRLVADGWLTAREVELVHGRSHGWIDILAFDPRTRTLLVIEIKTRLDDVGAVERQLAWYERGAWTAAATLGWRPRRVLSWLLVLATDEIDAAVRANRDVLARGFPRRARQMTADLLDPDASPLPTRGLALIDPSSRRREWLIQSRVDGRRAPLRYRGYAEAAHRAGGGRS
jgi:transcriptional regulator with XRE-family HTH domain